jgi:hypothetical protein
MPHPAGQSVRWSRISVYHGLGGLSKAFRKQIVLNRPMCRAGLHCAHQTATGARSGRSSARIRTETSEDRGMGAYRRLSRGSTDDRPQAGVLPDSGRQARTLRPQRVGNSGAQPCDRVSAQTLETMVRPDRATPRRLFHAAIDHQKLAYSPIWRSPRLVSRTRCKCPETLGNLPCPRFAVHALPLRFVSGNTHDPRQCPRWQ